MDKYKQISINACEFLGDQIAWLTAFASGLSDHAPSAAASLIQHIDQVIEREYMAMSAELYGSGQHEAKVKKEDPA